MKRLPLCALLLMAAGCSRQNPAPVVVAAPRPTATVTPTAAPIVVPPIAPVTPVSPPINGTVANGRVSEKERQFISSQIQKLATASPQQDFENAWAKRDYRFCAIRGAGRHYPGVPNNRVLALLTQYGDFPIEGTGDYFLIPEQLELQQLAGKYALQYNELLLARLDEQKPANQSKNSAGQTSDSAASIADGT